MITIQEACKIALKVREGYLLTSASEIDNGWLFSFGLENGMIPDEAPMFVSNIDGSYQIYDYDEHFVEILNAKPISLSDIVFDN